MADADARLIRCFAAIFRGLSDDEIRIAHIDTVPGWDSLATVGLVAVLEEEFQLKIDLSEWREMGSFDSIRRYLANRSVS